MAGMTPRRPTVRTLLFVVASLLLAAPGVRAQNKPATHDGPIIKGYGAVFPVPDADFKPPIDHVYKVVFSVTAVPKESSTLNRGINSVARFLNMQAQAGVPLANMHLALVLHGPAGRDALDNAAYRKRFGADNPNLPLLDALQRAGVAIYLCGQTAAALGFHKNELARPVKLALSAMTVITTLEGEGYVLMP